MVPLPFNLCSNRNEGRSSSPPARPHQHDFSTPSRSNSFEGGISMEALHPKVKQYGQDMAKKRRASDSAYITKSAGYWEKTTEGRAAMERYEEDMKTVKGRQNDSFECRRKFCGVSLCSHSINLPPQSPINGSDGYKQRARRSIFDDELESYDRELLSSLDARTSGDSKILEREQKIEHSLESVRRRLEADERAFHEKVAREFESGVHHHLRNFDRDLDQLKSCLLNLHRDVVECERGPTSQMATNLIVLAAHQAYELDIILLTKYRFLQRINEIRKGPIGGRNEKAIIQAFEYAEVRALREITLDGLEHSCEPHSDPLHPFARCPACHKHALELFEPRNDEIHQNVLQRGLYHFGKTPDTTAKQLNVQYYFIAFACKIVKERDEWQQNPNSHIRKDIRDRMFLLFDNFYKHCMEQKPSTCQETNQIYLNLRKYWKSVRHDDIENKLQELERQNQTNSQRNDPPPQPIPHPRSDLGPPPSPDTTPRSQSLPHVMTARNPLVASSASPNIESITSEESQESSRRRPGVVSRTRSRRSAPANPRRQDSFTTRTDHPSAENSDLQPRPRAHSPPHSPSSPPSQPVVDPRSISPSSSRPQTAPASSHEPADKVPGRGPLNRFRNRLYSAPTLDRPHESMSSPPDITTLLTGLAATPSKRGRIRRQLAFKVLPPIKTATPTPSGSPSRSPNHQQAFCDSGYNSPFLLDENGHLPPQPPRLRSPSLGVPLVPQVGPDESNDSEESVDSVEQVREVRGRGVGRQPSTTSTRDFAAIAYSPGRREARRSVSVHRI